MNASTNTITFSLDRHNLGHGPQGGAYVSPVDGNVTNYCPKESVSLRAVKAAMDTLGLASEVGEYYSPVGSWERLTVATQGLCDVAYFLAVDMFEDGEDFDIKAFRATYVH
jgi:hypothetical protein